MFTFCSQPTRTLATLLRYASNLSTRLILFLLLLRLSTWQAPTKLNFDLAQQRRQAAPTAAESILSQLQAASLQQQQDDLDSASNFPGDESAWQQDATFQSAASSVRTTATGSSSRGGSRGGRGTTKGRSTSATVQMRKREKMRAWIDSVVQSLPLAYREPGDARDEMSQVLFLLREHPEGLYVSLLACACCWLPLTT